MHYAPWLLNFRAPLLRALRSSGVRVTVLAPGEHPEVRVALLEMGVDYQSYPLERTGLNPGRDVGTFSALVRRLRQLRPTHVLTTAIKPNIYGVLAARLTGVQRVYALVTGLGYAFSGDSPRQRQVAALATVLYRIAFRGVTRVIFQNPDDRDLLVSRGAIARARTEIVAGSGVDLAHYPPAFLPPQPPVVFLMVARLIAEKGVHEYVRAARHLRSWGVACEVHLAGPLDENPASLRQTDLDALVAEGSVTYLGELNDVRPSLAACHVFVLPSYREGTPRSTLEALATGRAVITTDAPGCRETVQAGQNGLLIPVADAGALARAMRELAEDSQRVQAFAEASLNLARRKYDVNFVNTRMLTIMGLGAAQQS